MIASMMYGVGVDAAEHAGQQRDAVAEREQADVEDDVLQPVEKEDHADQEQQVVVAGDHVLGAEVHERPDGRAVDRLEEQRVAARNAMRAEGVGTERKEGAVRMPMIASWTRRLRNGRSRQLLGRRSHRRHDPNLECQQIELVVAVRVHDDTLPDFQSRHGDRFLIARDHGLLVDVDRRRLAVFVLDVELGFLEFRDRPNHSEMFVGEHASRGDGDRHDKQQQNQPSFRHHILQLTCR